jgi:hypothetical protein
MSNFDSVKVGGIFRAEGVVYRKTSAQVYVDISSGIESYWDPFFDQKIEGQTGTVQDPKPDANAKFIVDPATRVQVPNPNYLNAEGALEELYNSGLFNCTKTDYRTIVDTCLEWGKSIKKS